jgi:hypothetical protein
MGGISTRASKATAPNEGFVSNDPHIKFQYLAHNGVLILYIFLLCRLKINHVMELGMCVYSWDFCKAANS